MSGICFLMLSCLNSVRLEEIFACYICQILLHYVNCRWQSCFFWGDSKTPSFSDFSFYACRLTLVCIFLKELWSLTCSKQGVECGTSESFQIPLRITLFHTVPRPKVIHQISFWRAFGTLRRYRRMRHSRGARDVNASNFRRKALVVEVTSLSRVSDEDPTWTRDAQNLAMI